jgi:23S rRNA (pseudouridine1915-N3)-methyltransferase
MNILILAVGSLSIPGLQALSKEYEQRLTHYTTLDIKVIKEAKGSPSDILTKEASAIRALIPPKARVVVLALEGTPMDSAAFAAWMDQHQTYHPHPLVFIIGGSTGLAPSFKQETMLQLSTMTFPHQLARVLLLEQLYRGFKILNHETYHK